MNKVIITLTNGESDYELEFRLKDLDVTRKWLNHVDLFVKAGCPWSDPERFYNFPNSRFPKEKVIKHLNELITTISDYAPDIIKKKVWDDFDRDDLNYLHHIFEVYHGMYDCQDGNEFFKHAPQEVKDALGELNIWIHRYETLGEEARFVGAWKSNPYRSELSEDDFKLFTLEEQWGDLMINYCEIGKTLYDLWHDDDKYISARAFQPLRHVCLDFLVRFNDANKSHYQALEQKIWQYYDEHEDFFHDLGYQKHDPRLSLGYLSIGELCYSGSKEQVIQDISQHQRLKSIRVI
jgi:hypothetical protein